MATICDGRHLEQWRSLIEERAEHVISNWERGKFVFAGRSTGHTWKPEAGIEQGSVRQSLTMKGQLVGDGVRPCVNEKIEKERDREREGDISALALCHLSQTNITLGQELERPLKIANGKRNKFVKGNQDRGMELILEKGCGRWSMGLF